MRARDLIRRSGVGIEPDRSIRDAAQVMEQSGVGALVVLDHDRVVGLVTDRDLVRRGLARGLPSDARIDGLMSTPVTTIEANTTMRAVVEKFRTSSFRRLAVVEGHRFVGMLTVDDLLVEFATEFTSLLGPVEAQMFSAQHDSPVPATA